MKRLQAANYAACYIRIVFTKKFYGAIHCHIKDIGYVNTAIFHFEHFALKAFSMAFVAHDGDIGKELHLDSYHSLTLTFLATTAFGVE